MLGKKKDEFYYKIKQDYYEREKEMKQYNNTDLWVLKNLKKNLKGMSFIWKLKTIRDNIKWAFQRAWRGYDDISVISYDLWFPDITMQILKDLYVVNQGSWAKPTEERKDENDIWYELDETQAKIKNMVMLLNIVNDFKNDDDTIHKAEQEFLGIFSKHISNLWW